MFPKIFMDFCPSESLGGVEKYPESPFTAAGCVFLAEPSKQKEIEDEIRDKLGKTKAARNKKSTRLEAMAFLREKIESSEVAIFALCVQRTERDLAMEGAINCMRHSTLKLVEGLSPDIMYNAAKAEVEESAEELGVSAHTVISNMATLMMSHMCVVHFLEMFNPSGIFKGGDIHVILDKLPGIGKHKLEKFQAISARFVKIPHKQYLDHYGARVLYTHLKNEDDDPCGVLVSDMLAHLSSAITESIRSPGDTSPPIKRSPQLPEYSDEEKGEIRDFLDFFLKYKKGISHFLMVTPEMLMAMVNVGGEMRDKIFRMQLELGLEAFNYFDPQEFLSPEAQRRR